MRVGDTFAKAVLRNSLQSSLRGAWRRRHPATPPDQLAYWIASSAFSQ